MIFICSAISAIRIYDIRSSIDLFPRFTCSLLIVFLKQDIVTLSLILDREKGIPKVLFKFFTFISQTLYFYSVSSNETNILDRLKNQQQLTANQEECEQK